MSGVKITIPKQGQLASIFGGFRDALPNRLRKATASARKLLVPLLAAYPAAPPNSRYHRTEELKRGWERASPIVGTKFELVNPAQYASLVQGDRQAWMHVGRWTPASQIAQEHEAEITDRYDQAVKDTIHE